MKFLEDISCKKAIPRAAVMEVPQGLALLLLFLIVGEGEGGVPGGNNVGQQRVAGGSPIIHLQQQGDVQGIFQQDTYQYLGIPYAAPPLGSLRWAAPRPPSSWKGIFNASKYSEPCSQVANSYLGFDQNVYNEDCLYVFSSTLFFILFLFIFSFYLIIICFIRYANVFLPKNTFSGAALPVMVWIHGGAFRMGSGKFSAQNIASQGNVIGMVPLLSVLY